MSVRVHALAKELGLSSKELLEKLTKLKVKVKGHMSSLDEETAQIIRAELKGKAQTAQLPTTSAEIQPEKGLKELQVKLPLPVKELAVKLSVKPSELIKQLMQKKIMATINQALDEEIVVAVLKDYGYTLKRLPGPEEELLAAHRQKVNVKELTPRAPVVTLMGHVDHGKTSLLDLIRKSRVAQSEAGGITQHIGAYEVKVNKKKITFLDTPGHEAFTAMRARGANATDIVVLVVAANDGVMPQTIEAIDHARAAKVPIVVAINKCDLPNINIARVKAQLSQHNLLSEDMGGKTISVNVSAKSGQGLDELLEMILLEAEMLELKANFKRPGRGVVIEGRLSRGTGPTVTVLIQDGKLKMGDVLICGNYYGRVKSMINDQGKQIEEAGPADPVEISGLSGVPEAGELFYVVEDEKKARDFSLARLEEKKLRGILRTATHISLEEVYQQIKEGKIKELNVIIKADVQGSLGALLESLQKLGSKDITMKVIHSAVGNVNISDVMLASVSNAIVLGFHVTTEARAKELAEKEKVDIRLYNIIYEALEDVKSALEGMLEPQMKEVFVGRAQVRQIFKISKIGNIAGCVVLAGKIIRDAHCRVLRNNEEAFKGKVSSLKKFKEDTKEVTAGNECGIGIANFKDVRPADIIECFEIEKVARRL